MNTKEQMMREFFVVANACEYTGHPVAGTMEVFTNRAEAEAAMVRSEQEDPGQFAQMWAQCEGGGFRAVAFAPEGVVEMFE
jgi:hypothetical protein